MNPSMKLQGHLRGPPGVGGTGNNRPLGRDAALLCGGRGYHLKAFNRPPGRADHYVIAAVPLRLVLYIGPNNVIVDSSTSRSAGSNHLAAAGDTRHRRLLGVARDLARGDRVDDDGTPGDTWTRPP